ncbi:MULTISPECIES: hypothetical protein [Spirosoma]|uniref:Uncharacterized protein n=1 Tax=Spirosoma liriopis TaxID=2937440 RepID=A0ABT0HEG7_9BACT|nr:MULTISPECIES: hypothetical protein [Spirosoma]MCK8490556.1 hypothetical protein [Spirosoma liriopis]UHG89922.1 hypothetical protein LQ777_16910 [Spirosoma oryzicola]
MKITRENYDRQPMLIRQGALALWGVPLAKREDLCRMRELYSLEGFFVEACYDKETNKLTCICSFTRSDRLLPYVEPVEVSSIET